jgi:hypothetical protein
MSLSLGIPHAGLKLPGFKNPTTEIPTPPSDHIPLRRCCAFGAPRWRPLSFQTKRLVRRIVRRSVTLIGTARWAARWRMARHPVRPIRPFTAVLDTEQT